MEYNFQTDNFEFQYKEDEIENTVLWEKHCHERYEMIAVAEGDISIMLEGRSYHLMENQAVIIAPLMYHTVTARKGGNYRRVTAMFDITAVPAMLQTQFLKKNIELHIFYLSGIEELREICTQKSTRFFAPLAESIMIQAFYGDVQAKHEDTEYETDEALQKIISYIDEHLCEKILLDDIAIHTVQSKSSVCHLFQEKMNISPKQYILQKKLGLATKLIRSGTPPTLAAIQVGYENYSNFYRMYQKFYKTSPTKNKK